jgi:hypothetical protein
LRVGVSAGGSLLWWVSGVAELGAEFAEGFLVAGVLVGEPLCTVCLLGLARGAGGGEFGSKSGQLGALLGGLGLPVLGRLPGRGQLR